MKILKSEFFNKDATELSIDLLGKVLMRKYNDLWLAAYIIETEAYYLKERASHASLGFTNKRKALFMPAGTIYMYYARGNDSLNISANGKGNAVLIKSAYPYTEHGDEGILLDCMRTLNPAVNGQNRQIDKLCSGQTLLCKSLDIKVKDWNQKQFDDERFYIADIKYLPDTIVQTKRLGIPKGRDEHLMYRFVDYKFVKYCTSNPLTKRSYKIQEDYRLLSMH